MRSTLSDLRFGRDFDCKTRTIHPTLKCIFRAASNLAQLTQRPPTEGNPVGMTGPPHFLHFVGTIMRKSFMIVRAVAKRLTQTNQTPQDGPLFNGMQKKLPYGC